MSWLRIDDGFAENAKVAGLSDGALALWLRCACWSHREENKHTGGFIPTALLPVIGRIPMPRAKKLAAELVAANAGGTKSAGLWEEREGGWQFHDWAEYLPKEKMSAEESARLAGQRSAAVRKERHGTAQPTRHRTAPNELEPFEDRSTERRSPNEPPNEVRTSRTPVPVPVPVPESGGGSAREACPVDLELTPDQLGQLMPAKGVTAEFAAASAAHFRGQWASDPPVPLDQWRRRLFGAISGAWASPVQRARILGTSAPTPPAERSRVAQVMALPVQERARAIVAERALGSSTSAEEWPEVVALAERLGKAIGIQRPRLGAYAQDRGAQAVVLLLSHFDAPELERAVTRAGTDEWLRANAKGLSVFTLEVVRQLLEPPRAGRGARQPNYEGEATFSAAAALLSNDEHQEISA